MPRSGPAPATAAAVRARGRLAHRVILVRPTARTMRVLRMTHSLRDDAA